MVTNSNSQNYNKIIKDYNFSAFLIIFCHLSLLFLPGFAFPSRFRLIHSRASVSELLGAKMEFLSLAGCKIGAFEDSGV
jgi:hypothetical protein